MHHFNDIIGYHQSWHGVDLAKLVRARVPYKIELSPELAEAEFYNSSSAIKKGDEGVILVLVLTF